MLIDSTQTHITIAPPFCLFATPVAHTQQAELQRHHIRHRHYGKHSYEQPHDDNHHDDHPSDYDGHHHHEQSCEGTTARPVRKITLPSGEVFCLRLPRFLKNPELDVLGNKQFVRTWNDACGLYGIVFSPHVPARGGPPPHIHFAGNPTAVLTLCLRPPQLEHDLAFCSNAWCDPVHSLQINNLATIHPICTLHSCFGTHTYCTLTPICSCLLLAEEEYFLPGTPQGPGDVVRIHAQAASTGPLKSYTPGQVPAFNMPAVTVGGIEVPYGSIGYSPIATPHTWKA